MKKIIALLLSMPKSLYVNFKCFDLRTAYKFPVLVSYRVRLKGLKRGAFVFDNCDIKPGMVRLGISDGAYEKGKFSKSYLAFAPESKIIIRGGVHIANNFIINMCPNGELVLGNNFSSNFDLTISCSKHIAFGNDCLLGWNCTFIDGDGHWIYDELGNTLNEDREIVVGNSVWIAAEVTFLKGARVADGNVVGFGSIVSKVFKDKNCIIAGTPARIVRERIGWKH